jgi:hypothetical protein
LRDKKETPVPIKIRRINDKSKREFMSSLENKDWSNVLRNFEPENAFKQFFDSINDFYNEHFPEKTVNQSHVNKNRSPWMTQGIFESRKKKQKLFNQKLKNPSPDNVKSFKEYNAIYTKMLRKARHEYYQNKFKEFSNDSKKTWQTINEVLGRRKNVNSIPKTFVSNEKIISGSFEIAQGFNEFFVNIGPKLAQSIPKSKKHFSEFLNEPCNENFVFANINESIIREALKKLKNKNSSGPDGISTNLLKSVAPLMMEPLIHLFNLSFKSGYIPTCLKTAEIVPIYKKDEANEYTNYRPISLLSSFAKLLEKIAANQMMKYLRKFRLLYEHQYGFRSGYNTEQPVVQLLDKIFDDLNNVDGNRFTLAIFIDLTKAFDTCSIEILLYKLNFYGFRGVANTWFESYLRGRYQYTTIRGEHSSLKEISCGVPQGSILGPLLFILLINDLPNASLFFKLLYADDTTLIKSGSDLFQLYRDANVELEKLSDWFKANKLTLNISKTKYILFRDKKQIVNFSELDLKIDGENIERIGENCKDKYFKFVGLFLDEHLTWNYHAQHIRGKAASTVYALSKLRNLLPKKVKYTVYNSLFRSYIEYGCLCWGNSNSKDINRISVLQKRAVRYIDNAKYNTHTGPIFEELKILKFQDLVLFNQASFMYKLVNEKLPLSFVNFFKRLNNFERNLSFALPSLNRNSLKILPSFCFIKIWNGLPLELKRKKSLGSFKNHYSRFLSINYSTPCTVANCFACRK